MIIAEGSDKTLGLSQQKAQCVIRSRI